MLGIYLFAAILGGGLLVLSMVGSDSDSYVDTGADFDGGGDGHDAPGGHHGAGELVVGLFRPRNLVFLLAAFGVTGALLTWLGTNSSLTAVLALVMGTGAMTLSHGVFTWLRRNDASIDAVGDVDLEGLSARVVLPLAPGEPGRVVCVIGGREQYLTARLRPGVAESFASGKDVVIVSMANGVAEVAPFDVFEIPPGPPSQELKP